MKTGSVVLLVIIGILLVGGIIYFSMQSQQVVGQVTGNNQNSTVTTSMTPDTNPAVSVSTGVKYDVNIMSFAFSPQTLTISPGSTVIWTNSDSVAHTVVSDTGNEIDSPNLAQGESYSHIFTIPGTYTYHCSIHPSMTGTIVVTSSNISSSSSSGSSGNGYY